MSSHHPPVMFIHGLWLHGESWRRWQERFEAAGYETSAPGWPGEHATAELTRADPLPLAGHGIAELTDHYAAIVERMPVRPIVIGHSFGGLVAQLLLDRGLAVAAIGVDSEPVKGVHTLPERTVRALWPIVRNPRNRRRAVMLSEADFRYGVTNTIPKPEADALYERYAIPGPARLLFEESNANVNPRSPARVDRHNSRRGPLLLIAGGRDNIVPASVSRENLHRYEEAEAVTDLLEFPDRGHSLTVDHGWSEVADAALAWLERQRLRVPSYA